jgi:HSP20 family protein
MSKHAKSDDSGKSMSAPPPATGLTPFEEMETWFDALQNRWLSQRLFDLPTTFGGRLPKVDVIDREGELCVRAELPGVSKDDLSVTLHDNLLGIHAKVEKEERQEAGKYHRRELLKGEFQRTLQLPAHVDSENVKATFKEGILELILPKLGNDSPKKIKVE